MAVGPSSLQTQASNAKALDRAAVNLGKVLASIGVGGKEGLADVAVVALNRVRQNLSKAGTGRTYRRPGARGPRSVIHRASAPGRPPAVDTGQLRASYTWRLGQGLQGPYAEIGTNLKTAPWLEFGTRRMAPRPHLRPTINSIRAEITRMIRDGVVSAERQAIGRLPREIV